MILAAGCGARVGSNAASSTASLSASVLLVSTSPDRSSAAQLSDSTLQGNVFIFTDPEKDSCVREVDFYLDDTDMAGEPTVQYEAPFDMEHTAPDGSANPLDTTTLKDGPHTVTVEVTMRSGRTSVVTASFQVDNGGVTPPPPPPPAPDAGTPDSGVTPPPPPPAPDAGTGGGTTGRVYPLHTAIVATTFWIGEIFDPTSPNGSQVFSTYDSKWEAHFGGCDGDNTNGTCQTEARTAANGYFPLHMTPHENPFYLDLPFDDLHNATAFAERARVIPWANDPGYAGHATDTLFSYMKNRWVKLMKDGHVCYAQNEDAGPAGASAAGYEDVNYVFGSNDARPLNKLYNGAGMDVSPALNGCLGFADLNGQNDQVTWQFVDDVDVPPGPWKTVVTTSQITP